MKKKVILLILGLIFCFSLLAVLVNKDVNNDISNDSSVDVSEPNDTFLLVLSNQEYVIEKGMTWESFVEDFTGFTIDENRNICSVVDSDNLIYLVDGLQNRLVSSSEEIYKGYKYFVLSRYGTFHVDSVHYEYERGQTWWEWIHSEYNTKNFDGYNGNVLFENLYLYQDKAREDILVNYREPIMGVLYVFKYNPDGEYIRFYVDDEPYYVGKYNPYWVNVDSDSFIKYDNMICFASNTNRRVYLSEGFDAEPVEFNQKIISEQHYYLLGYELQFKVEGTSYTFVRGMTWREWIFSSYSTTEFTVLTGYIKYNGEPLYYVPISSENKVKSGDLIGIGTYCLKEE